LKISPKFANIWSKNLNIYIEQAIICQNSWAKLGTNFLAIFYNKSHAHQQHVDQAGSGWRGRDQKH
jgi:hypothetical protein